MITTNRNTDPPLILSIFNEEFVTGEIYLKRDHMRLCWLLVNNRPMLKASISLLKNIILCGDITLSLINNKTGDKYTMSEEFKCLINMHWKRFLNNALTHLMAFGFVPYKIKEDKKLGFKIPQIPLFDTYDIRMDYSDPCNIKLKYESKLDSNRKIDKDIKFFIIEYPNKNGTVTSHISPLLRDEILMQTTEKLYMDGIYKQTNPTLIIEKKGDTQEDLVSITSKEGVDALSERYELLVPHDILKEDIHALKIHHCIVSSLF